MSPGFPLRFILIATPIIVSPYENLNNKTLGGHALLSFRLSLTRSTQRERDRLLGGHRRAF